MKKFFVSLVMLLGTSAACVFAQSSLIATLSHEGEVSMFYGVSALQQAHEAATHGDVITLSSGTFSAVNITKVITLRGAGFELDVENNLYPTTIAGDFTINISEDTTEKLLIEGIYSNHYIAGTFPETTFMKCRLHRMDLKYCTPSGKATFIHCKLVSPCKVRIPTLFVNSFICQPQENSGTEYVNCILYYSGNYGLYTSGGSLVLKNCIVVLTGSDGGGSYFSPSSSAYKCIAVDDSGDDVWTHLSNASVYTGVSYSDIFSTFTGVYSDTESFELTDEAKAKYLGLDGTEIGIYGGSLPFDPKTSAPQVTKFNVASKSTVDGKLSVDIEVKGVE